MSSVIRSRKRYLAGVMAACSGVIISAGCAIEPPDEEVSFNATEQEVEVALAANGDPLPGISAADFAEAKAAFDTKEEITDGLGPVFNDVGCGVCHDAGAVGGSSSGADGNRRIERRFGTFDANGRFVDLANRGGSLRQLRALPAFTGANGQRCTVPVEREPAEATVHNVGRLTTPLFGAGLIDSLPDSAIIANQNNQPSGIRGTVNQVRVLIPNPNDPSQAVGSTRVGRFGWKGGVPTLHQFSADAYLNEMGISTQHCVRGTSILDFARESRPNGIAQPAGCDDLAPANGFQQFGVPVETDDAVGNCRPNGVALTEIQDDVQLFTNFMTFLSPLPRLPIDPNINLQGGTVFNRIGCAGCHLLRDYVTPSRPANGVPGNMVFRPRSDFLSHDIGTGDNIANNGESRAAANRIRTAPLWGLHARTAFLHDGSASSIEAAIDRHHNQAQAARDAFFRLNSSDRNAMLTAMRSD